MPKAAVGRIVHVLVDPKHNNYDEVAPAVITHVWSEQCVNLRVLHDGPSAAPEGRRDWLTSTSLYESREALEAVHTARQADLPEDLRSDVRYGAFWPPHV